MSMGGWWLWVRVTTELIVARRKSVHQHRVASSRLTTTITGASKEDRRIEPLGKKKKKRK